MSFSAAMKTRLLVLSGFLVKSSLGWGEERGTLKQKEFFRFGVLVNTDAQQSVNALRAPNSLQGL